MNFLVVDMSSTGKKMLSSLITKEDELVESDGQSAFKELTKQGFDLILVDLDNESSQGAAFVRKVKGNSILKRKKIAVLVEKLETAKGKFDSTVLVVQKSEEKIKELVEKTRKEKEPKQS